MNSIPDQSSLWYVKFSGRVEGPLTSQELIHQVEIHQIRPETLIRPEHSQNWVTAKSVPELFPKQEEDSNSESASRAAADLLAGRGIRRAFSSAEEEDETVLSRFSEFTSRLNLDWFRELVTNITEFLAEKLEFLKFVFRPWVLVPLLLIVIAGLTVNYYAIDWYRRNIAYETYSNIWFDLRRLREMDLDARQWDEFKADVTPKIMQINQSIEKVATTNDPYTMELLRAGRDCLPRMLDDAREIPSSSEKQFAVHMSKAERLAHSASGKPLSENMMDLFGMVFIVFDVALVGVGAVFVVRKLRM